MEFRISPVSFVVLLVLFCTVSRSDRLCDTVKVLVEKHCGENEMCSQKTPGLSDGMCKCVYNYKRTTPDGPCLPVNNSNNDPQNPRPEASSVSRRTRSVSASTIAVAVLIPVVVVAGSALVYAAYQRQWLQRLRMRSLRALRYVEVRIGHDHDDDDDDPPVPVA